MRGSRISPPNCAAATAGRREEDQLDGPGPVHDDYAACQLTRKEGEGADPTGSRHAHRTLPLRGPLPLPLKGGEGLLQPCARGGGSGGGEEMILHLVARRLGAVVFA